MMDMNQYLEIFIEESKEHLQNLNQNLLELEKNPDNSAVLNEIFRMAHTLKGMAGTMGFNKMTRLTHDMEDVLQGIRNNAIKVTSELIDILFECMDALESYLDQIISNGNEGNEEYNDLISSLGSIAANGTAAGKNGTAKQNNGKSVSAAGSLKINQYEAVVINKARDEGNNAFFITVQISKNCVLKSARAFIIFQVLEKYTEIIKSEPKVEDIEDEKFDFEFSVIVLTKVGKDVLDKELNSVSEVENVIISTIDDTNVSIGTASSQTAQTIEKPGLKDEGTDDKTEASAAKGDSNVKAKSVKTVRVDIDRLDMLMNLVGELIITKTQLKGIEDLEKNQTYNETIEYLERITTSLNDAVMKVRMVPVETVFNRFPKMIRSIAKEIGKDIELTMTGIETELDKTVNDEIGEPLVHLLRNSADHGIESPERRRESGKPETGHIYLRAYQEGNNVIIEVEDDGSGMDVEKIKKKAIEKGFIDTATAETMKDEDAINLLFKPSFSTAEKVTDLSGRGVGLDVVKTKIESLGGFVEVESQFGKGSKFIIRLPLTLAIIQAMLVMVGDEKYAIPLSSIKRIVNVNSEEVKMVQKQEVILLNNVVVPVIRLDKVLEVVKGEENSSSKKLTVVIVKKGDKLYGLTIDAVIGQQEIVQKSLGKLLSSIRQVTGATIMGNGSVALILDVNSIV